MKSSVITLLLIAAITPAWANDAAIDYNRPKDEQGIYDPRQKSDMDNLASAEELASLVSAAKTDALLFTEDREHSIRWTKAVPKRWLTTPAEHTGEFKGTAQPGEFYVFQLGVYAAKRDLASLSIVWNDLKGQASEIKASEFRCFNLGGVNSLGQAFTKDINVAKGKLQPLWIGVTIPRDARGAYAGTIILKDSRGLELSVGVKLNIQGPVLTDFGDKDSWRLSRLRWLDSAIGFDDNTVTRPFVPLTRRDNTIAMLGRELVLEKSGLPGRIRSFFSGSNTSIGKTPTRQLLTSPFRFVIELADGNSLVLTPGQVEVIREQKGAIETRTLSRGEGVELTVETLVEYDGFARFLCRIKPQHDIQVKDVRLEFSVTHEAEYFMGLGQRTGRGVPKADWKWNPSVHQDGFWIGAVNGGFKIQFFGDNYRTPLINCYYHYRALNTPESWGGADGNSGGIRLNPGSSGDTQIAAYSGPRLLKGGDQLNYGFKLFLTPFKTLNTEEQWSLRYHHANNEAYRDANIVKSSGANTINIHQSREANPTINYPYFDLSMPLLKQVIADAHAAGLKVKAYYTTREITNNLKELFAFWSLDGEIICPSPGMDGVKAHPLTNGKGPHPWLVEHLGETGFIPAWRDVLRGPYKGMLDLAVITTPDSRLDNFYLEGLAFTLRETGVDGVYIDDTAMGRKAFQRAHRVFESAGKPLLADMHSWNHRNPTAGTSPSAYVFMQNYPYYHRIWHGESFNCNMPPDSMLVEQAGIPFGLMSEMLNGPNPWHGMVFGETVRLGWSGNPRPIWKFWDDFGMAGTELIGYWDPTCPVKCDNENVLVTVYRKQGKSLLAIGSWADKKLSVKLKIDWKALGLDPAKATLYAPAIADFQAEAVFASDAAIPVAKGKGWLLIVDETPRKPSEISVMDDPLKGMAVKASDETVFEIKTPANTVKTKDVAWHKGATAVAARIDPQKDEGQTWGVGLAVAWESGKYVQANARTDGRWELRKNGQPSFAGSHSKGTPATLAVKLTDKSVQIFACNESDWELLAEYPRNEFPEEPATIRFGKIGPNWKPVNHSPAGTTTSCRVEWVKQY